VIEIERLTVRFGGVTSLRELDVAFADRVTGIVGPNGAGKTTLLNVLSGFVRPDAGDIRIDRASIARIVPHRRAAFGVRRTFQTEQVVENRSVIDNVAAAADHVPLARGHADAVRRALEIVGLERAVERRAGELGMFERRMLEIARAIVGQPKVVMLDEPGAGLAEAESSRLRAVVASLPERTGTQVLLVDHDVDFIAAVCSSTLVLDFGSRIAFGPTADVLADPRVRAAYLGTPDEVLA
jgi:ABC-type branched-subunit amino acid transport system ATPase component